MELKLLVPPTSDLQPFWVTLTPKLKIAKPNYHMHTIKKFIAFVCSLSQTLARALVINLSQPYLLSATCCQLSRLACSKREYSPGSAVKSVAFDWSMHAKCSLWKLALELSCKDKIRHVTPRPTKERGLRTMWAGARESVLFSAYYSDSYPFRFLGVKLSLLLRCPIIASLELKRLPLPC